MQPKSLLRQENLVISVQSSAVCLLLDSSCSVEPSALVVSYTFQGERAAGQRPGTQNKTKHRRCYAFTRQTVQLSCVQRQEIETFPPGRGVPKPFSFHLCYCFGLMNQENADSQPELCNIPRNRWVCVCVCVWRCELM